VLDATYAIPSEANYQRFCSNFLAGKEHGFERELLFTNEEATDLVYRTGDAWPLNEPADPREPEQAGVVVALDVKTGQYRTIYGMGRHNHENSVALPGDRPVVLSGDDTFSAPSSQLYMYTAGSAAEVWDDEGTLWAFKSNDPAVNDYGDLGEGDSVEGTFVEVPREVAVGDQAALESWSNANGVFQFIRLEDIAYDRSDPSRVYLADTGEPRAISNEDPAQEKLVRGPSGTMGPYPNGRIFVLDVERDGNAADPTGTATLSVLIDADQFPAGALEALHQPDNLETTKRSLLIQEDPGSHNQYALPAGEGETSARIWRYDLGSGQLEVVARVDQSQDTTGARLGAWESSGIIDASRAFGRDWFLVDVQAGTISLDRVEGPDGNGDGRPDTVLEREGGQLLLLRIPGA
jgi:secreted PhoX family phosphatase